MPFRCGHEREIVMGLMEGSLGTLDALASYHSPPGTWAFSMAVLWQILHALNYLAKEGILTEIYTWPTSSGSTTEATSASD